MNKLDKFLVFNIAFMVLFTITDIILTCFGIYLSVTLEQCAFTYFLGECGITGLIKISSEVETSLRARREMLEDRAYYESKENK